MNEIEQAYETMLKEERACVGRLLDALDEALALATDTMAVVSVGKRDEVRELNQTHNKLFRVLKKESSEFRKRNV